MVRLRCGCLLIGMVSLAFYSCTQTEKTEAITAEITAAQMEGRRAAGLILAPNWQDSTLLQKALIETKVKQSQYLINGNPKAAEAFDSSFLSTIRSVNPDLARKITPQRVE